MVFPKEPHGGSVVDCFGDQFAPNENQRRQGEGQQDFGEPGILRKERNRHEPDGERCEVVCDVVTYQRSRDESFWHARKPKQSLGDRVACLRSDA